jgi:hypothetical protein
MTAEEIRDKVEDLYMKETNRFAFLRTDDLDKRYIQWLELQVYNKFYLPTAKSKVCENCGSNDKYLAFKWCHKCLEKQGCL